MKREDIERIFDGATKEQIDSVLNINSQDIGNAKKDYDDLKARYEKLGDDYDELKTKADAGGDLQTQIDSLTQSLADRDDELKTLKLNSALELKLAFYLFTFVALALESTVGTTATARAFALLFVYYHLSHDCHAYAKNQHTDYYRCHHKNHSLSNYFEPLGRLASI